MNLANSNSARLTLSFDCADFSVTWASGSFRDDIMIETPRISWSLKQSKSRAPESDILEWQPMRWRHGDEHSRQPNERSRWSNRPVMLPIIGFKSDQILGRKVALTGIREVRDLDAEPGLPVRYVR
jgi:hypothetical protein